MGHVLPPPEKAPDQAEEAPLGAHLPRHRGADPPCLFTGGRQGLGLDLELQPPAPLGRCDADRPLRPPLTAAGSDPPFPHRRIAPLVQDRDDHGSFVFEQEVHRIRELVKKATSYRPANERKLEREFGDAMDELEELGGKELAQTQPLILIPERGLFNIDLRLRSNEEVSSHSQRERRCFNFSVISSRTSSQGRATPGSARWAARRPSITL